MTTRMYTVALALGSAGLLASKAAAEHVFTFSGSVISGHDVANTDLSGSRYTLSMYVLDLAADLTPGANAANYLISSASFDLNSDSSVEEVFTPNASTYPAVYIDAGSTQLVGAFDLGGAFATFLIGVHLPGDAFADPHDLSGQTDFSLTNLASASFSFYQSAEYNLVLNLDAFSYETTVVPLPSAALAGSGLLALGLIVRGVRARRLRL